MLTERLDAGGGGVVTSAAGLGRALAAAGHDVHAVGFGDGVGDGRGEDPSSTWYNQSVHAVRDVGGAVRTVAALTADVVHQHGLWTRASLAGRRLARRGAPCVVSPHGMLDPWALALGNARAKRLMLMLHERRHLDRASCMHALGPAERRSFAGLGLAAPVAVVPNGIAVAAGGDPQRTRADLPVGIDPDVPYLLYLGRLAPIKGLAETIDAWTALGATRRNGWRLVIAGFGTDDQTATLVRRLEGVPPGQVTFVGAAHGTAKRALLAHASAFVLASRGEGQPMAALEAMGAGVPALLSRECNLADAHSVGAALRVPTDAAGLADAFARLIATPDSERRALGARAREFVAAGYSWTSVAERFADIYRWAAGHAPRPASVLDPARPGEPDATEERST